MLARIALTLSLWLAAAMRRIAGLALKISTGKALVKGAAAAFPTGFRPLFVIPAVPLGPGPFDAASASLRTCSAGEGVISISMEMTLAPLGLIFGRPRSALEFLVSEVEGHGMTKRMRKMVLPGAPAASRSLATSRRRWVRASMILTGLNT